MTSFLLFTTLLCCGRDEPPPSPEAPALPAIDPAQQARTAWSAVHQAVGSDAAPRALMDHVDPQVLGLHNPLELAQVLDRFIEDWGPDALGKGPPQIAVSTDHLALSFVGQDRAGQPLTVVVDTRQGLIWSIGVDSQPGRQPLVFDALEVSTRRMSSTVPAPFSDPTVATVTTEPLPTVLGQPGQAQVRIGDLTALAKLDRDTALAAMDPALHAAYTCYTARLEQNPKVAGGLHYRVELRSEHTPAIVNRKGHALDLALDHCTRQGLEQVHLPATDLPAVFDVSLFFSLPQQQDGAPPTPGDP
ncbi:MAG: hypothetical protein GXP62_12870 [Oligoflexia bacterium]|nr:hypothetical protein [Oligoflexia bacterium]